MRMPLAGQISLVLANLTTLIVMCFYGWNSLDSLNYENIGYRTGFVTIMQLPLIFLLAGKNNIIGLITGHSYERLNWLHRWSARCMFITATIHFAYWLADWWPYGDWISVKIRTDPITWRGLVAWCLLAWINFSSSMPVRGWGYEFFVVQHLISFAVMVGFIYWHVPSENHVWIWIATGVFWFDRLVRGLNVLYRNLSLFHPRQRRNGDMGVWACKAELTPQAHDTTRITIRDPPISWAPGQHMFLSCHSIVPLQSHPFTAASLPSDGKLEFLVRAQKGGTRRLFRHAASLVVLPSERGRPTKSVAIEGPYGRIRPLRQFDSVVLFAGSTGATFTVPLLRDLVESWKSGPSATRHIRFVWCVKSQGQFEWFAEQLAAVVADTTALQRQGVHVEVEISVYCTCDEKFTEEHGSLLTKFRSSGGRLSVYGQVEVRPASAESSDEGETKKQITTAVREIATPSSENGSGSNDAAGNECSAKECCCKATIEDEAAAEKEAAECTCSSVNAASAAPPPLYQFVCHPSIALLSGRPQCRNIMRQSLEQAMGESAVVVCGPRGLVEDVRRAYVGLCDERAVCKGTGAMGVYYHAESFSY